MFQYEKDQKHPAETILRRRVEDLMPLSSANDINKPFPNVKLEARRVYGLIDGYEYKEVHRAVVVRQDAQKYVRHNVRAKSFMEEYPRCRIEDVERNMSTHFFKEVWDEKEDFKKVCIVTTPLDYTEHV